MKENLNGTGYFAKVYPTHLANDEEFRRIFHPGTTVRYYLETLEIVEGVGVLVGVLPLDSDDPKMVPIPLAKLKFSERQFAEILNTHPKVYSYYRSMIAEILGIGNRQLSASQIQKQLRVCAMSAQTSYIFEENEDQAE